MSLNGSCISPTGSAIRYGRDLRLTACKEGWSNGLQDRINKLPQTADSACLCGEEKITSSMDGAGARRQPPSTDGSVQSVKKYTRPTDRPVPNDPARSDLNQSRLV